MGKKVLKVAPKKRKMIVRTKMKQWKTQVKVCKSII